MPFLYTPRLILQRAIGPFWHPAAVLALDFQNGQFMAAGKIFDSVQDMIAAGIYTRLNAAGGINGDTLNLAGIFSGGAFVLHGIAMADATGTGSGRHIAAVDSGATTDITRIARQTATTYRGLQISASTNVAQIDITVAATASTLVNMAMGVASANFDFAANGVIGTHDNNGAAPATPTTMFLGDIRAGSGNAWAGRIHYVELLAGSLTAAQFALLTAG